MKFLITLIGLATMANVSFGQEYKKFHEKYQQRHEPSEFEVISLNSPVKENLAKFLLRTPTGFVIEQVKYKVRNTLKLFEKDNDYSSASLVDTPKGKEFHLNVKNYPNGFYRLFVKVKSKTKDKTKKWIKKEIQFKSTHRDYVRFSVDRKKQVPMPNPEENNATIGGVDSDNDGLRDDVQIWIDSKTVSEEIKLAMKQYARTIRSSYLNISEKEKTIVLNHEALRSQECLGNKLMATGMSGGDVIKALGEIETFHENTKERVKASFTVDEYFHGQSMLRYGENACDL